MAVHEFFILLFLHFILSLCCLVLPSSRLYKRKEYWLPIIFVPLFGPLIALTIEIMLQTQKASTVPVDLESLKVENDIFWTPLSKSSQDDDPTPLEEVILLNDAHIRRKAVLNTFRDEPFGYLDVLMVARNNDDVDTTHYATIQISKIQRQFQLDLQKYAAEYEKDPANLDLVNRYIDLLGAYLQSSLPEKNILRHQRHVYGKLLDHKLDLMVNDKQTLIKKLRNCTDLHENYQSAQAVIDRLKEKWPDDEQTWIEILRTYVEWKDTDRIQETIETMRTHKIYWTKWGREQVSPWVQI